MLAAEPAEINTIAAAGKHMLGHIPKLEINVVTVINRLMKVDNPRKKI